MKAQQNKVVSLTYELRYDDAQGEVIEVISEKSPMNVILGHDMLLEKLEAQISGLGTGDSFTIKFTPEEAYGDYDEENIANVPMAELLDGLPEEAEKEVYEGNIIPVLSSENEQYEALVVEVKDGIVTLDFNHPLSGENLYMTGRVIGVRDATAEELETLDVKKF